jgi:TP901 family phage tail tape measure protein
MASKLDLRGEITLNVAPANAAMNGMSTKLRTMAQDGKAGTAAFKNLTAGIKAMGTVANAERASIAKLNTEIERTAKIKRESLASVAATKTSTIDKSAESQARQILTLNRAQTEEVRQRLLIQAQNDRSASAALRDQIALQKEARAVARAAAAEQNAANNALNGTRYALYDIAQNARNLGLGMLALAGATVGVAIAWEKDFAQVKRTVGGTQEQLATLRAEFVSMAQDLPVSFESITQVGTLAGQLGIARDKVADFTETTIKFSATTDVAVDQAATAFGRLDNILLDNSGQYENLASSVLQVGVNSVATESQILRITTQIASTAKQAGFTADQVIGLSGALASLAVPPELSRGVTTRVFGTIARAIGEGGIKLEQFGNIAGVSGKQFAAAWKQDSGAAFQMLLAGLKREGTGAEQALRDLGITSVRDVPILLRLANSGTVVADAFRDAQEGFAENTELTRQYAIIADTTSARITRLGNSFQAFLDAAGSGELGLISDFLDGLLGKIKDVTEALQTPTGQTFAGVALVVLTVVGVLSLLIAVGATAVAGYIALIAVMRTAQGMAGTNALSFASLNATLAATGPMGAKAALGIRILSVAMKALAAATVILLLPDIAKWAQDSADAAQGVGHSFEDTLARLKQLNDYEMTDGKTSGFAEWAALPEWIQNLNRAAANAGFGDKLSNDIKRVDDSLTTLADNGDWAGVVEGLNQAAKNSGVSMKEMLGALDGTDAALKTAGYTVRETSDGVYELSKTTNGVTEVVKQFTEAELEADEATSQFLQTAATADATFFDLKSTYDSMTEANKKLAQDEADATDDMSDSWQNYFDKYSVNLDDYLANLQKMIDAQSNWEANMFSLKQRGASDALIEQLMSLGVEGAPLVQAFIDGTDAQLQEANRMWEDGGGEGVTAFGKGMQDATPEFLTAVRAMGEDVYKEVVSGISSGSLTVQQAMDDLFGGITGWTQELVLPVSINDVPFREDFSTLEEYVTNAAVYAKIYGNTEPMRENFASEEQYIQAHLIWASIQGDTGPAREAFDSEKSYQEAQVIWLTSRGATAPARADFDSAKAYGDALTAYINVTANTWTAEQAINWAARNRTAIITANMVTTGAGQFKYNSDYGDTYATGGGVKGAYGPTADRVPALLSTGEHVFTAREVRLMGGQQAVYDFRRRLPQRMGYATGGEVIGTSANYQNSYASRQSVNTAQANRAMSQMVELSPLDRQLLAAAGNTYVGITEQTIAKANNRLIVRETNRGAY